MKKIIFKSFISALIFGTTLIGFLFIVVKARSGLSSSPGDKLTSTIWNNLISQVNSLSGNVVKTYGGKSLTSNGLYCGSTASKYDGAGVGGYAGAKTKCETTCGDPLAHMCDSHEILMSKQLGMTITLGSWISIYNGSYFSNTYPINDCSQWTSNSSSNAATYVYYTSNGVAAWDTCNDQRYIACCK